MAIELYKHNLDAYNAAVLMLEKNGRAAIVHPTGTGKSFIGFKLAEEHPNARVLWLTPSEYIVKTQLENLVKEGGAELSNITFVTYSRLMLMTVDELAELKPDFIICDEHHRVGAQRWLEGYKALISMYPNVKILGLSATNIRYLDNQRNMAEELFDGNIASEMTLGEAIARGILPAPKYVISVYAYEKELKKLEDRIDRITNKGIHDKTQRELDRLRRALEMADGLDKVFQKHIKNVGGKYIVFCSGRAHMDEMLSHVGEWFGDVNKNRSIYKVYSDDPSSSSDFKAFKEDNSQNLKLLFCIDMLNEGIHVSDVDGVIMFRPTVSPIVYKQQIGRALSASKSKQPIILDVVNNFENLYSISTIQEEINLAVSYYREHDEVGRIVNEAFDIIDETCECRQLFEHLEKSLSSTWETYFRAAKRYFVENGNLEVPKRYVTQDGLTLGMWIATQRRVRKGSVNGILTEAQIMRLDSIGMVWDNRHEQRWLTGYEHAKEYFEKFGNLDVQADFVTEDGFKLGSWISNNRTWYKNNSHSETLNKERIAMLEKIGMIWDKNNVLWERNFAEAEKYFKTHGNLNVPAEYVSESGIKLGAWIKKLRKIEQGDTGMGTPLTAEQKMRLDKIGMAWNGAFDSQWNRGYEAACEYYKNNGNLNIPVAYKTTDGLALGKWIRRQRDNKKLSPDRREKLCNIGMENNDYRERLNYVI